MRFAVQLRPSTTRWGSCITIEDWSNTALQMTDVGGSILGSCFQGLLYDYPTHNVGKWPNQQLRSVHNMRHMLTDTSFSNSIVVYVDKNRLLSAESSIYRLINLVLKIPNISTDSISMTNSSLCTMQKFTLEKSKDNMGGWRRCVFVCCCERFFLEQNLWQTKKKIEPRPWRMRSFPHKWHSYVSCQWTMNDFANPR